MAIKAIIYSLHKSGIKGKLLRIVNNMNQDLTARIQRKYGTTRKIKIRDSIRQGSEYTSSGRICKPHG